MASPTLSKMGRVQQCVDHTLEGIVSMVVDKGLNLIWGGGHADQREISSAYEIDAASLFGWIDTAGFLGSPNERIDWGIF